MTGDYLQFIMHAKSLQFCLTLCNPMDCSLPDSSVHGTLQARILEWVAFPSPGDLPDSRIEPVSPELQTVSLPAEPSRNRFLNISKYQCSNFQLIIKVMLFFLICLNWGENTNFPVQLVDDIL